MSDPRHMRVLIVFDTDEREMYATARRRLGFDVVCAASVAEAIGLVPECKPAAVLTDLRFSGPFTGIDLLESLRSDSTTCDYRSSVSPRSAARQSMQALICVERNRASPRILPPICDTRSLKSPGCRSNPARAGALQL